MEATEHGKQREVSAVLCSLQTGTLPRSDAINSPVPTAGGSTAPEAHHTHIAGPSVLTDRKVLPSSPASDSPSTHFPIPAPITTDQAEPDLFWQSICAATRPLFVFTPLPCHHPPTSLQPLGLQRLPRTMLLLLESSNKAAENPTSSTRLIPDGGKPIKKMVPNLYEVHCSNCRRSRAS